MRIRSGARAASATSVSRVSKSGPTTTSSRAAGSACDTSAAMLAIEWVGSAPPSVIRTRAHRRRRRPRGCPPERPAQERVCRSQQANAVGVHPVVEIGADGAAVDQHVRVDHAIGEIVDGDDHVDRRPDRAEVRRIEIVRIDDQCVGWLVPQQRQAGRGFGARDPFDREPLVRHELRDLPIAVEPERASNAARIQLAGERQAAADVAEPDLTTAGRTDRDAPRVFKRAHAPPPGPY